MFPQVIVQEALFNCFFQYMKPESTVGRHTAVRLMIDFLMLGILDISVQCAFNVRFGVGCPTSSFVGNEICGDLIRRRYFFPGGEGIRSQEVQAHSSKSRKRDIVAVKGRNNQ